MIGKIPTVSNSHYNNQHFFLNYFFCEVNSFIIIEFLIMKKFLTTLILIGIVFSCSSDEDDAPPPASIVKQYTLSVTAGQGGSVSTTGGTFSQGTEVSITATPSSGYSFSQWSNGSTTNPLTLTVNSNTNLTASFVAIVNSYTLTVSAGEGGTVSTEGGEYEEGTEVTITATPDDGYGFIGWEGNESTESSLTVVLEANTTLNALFGQLPVLILPPSPSNLFTIGVADILSIGFTSESGFKSIIFNADYGAVEVLEQPDEGVNEGTITFQYTPLFIENVDYMTTIAGYDELNITITSEEDIQNNYIYNIRTQPEPIYKNYNQPSHNLANTRVAINPPLIRYLNQKDNSQEDRCQYINGGLNEFGNLSDDYAGVAFADVNGDGYDDMFIHPVYTDGGEGGFSQIKNEYELYLYLDGEYVFHEINWEGNNIPKVHLARKILIGDYDNDGDPDFYSANFGIDGGSYETEKSLFIINNFNSSQSFSYRENPHMEGVHEASSADIDGDGDLDIFSISRLAISDPPSVFFKNNGNFDLENWAGYGDYDTIIEGASSFNEDPQWQMQYFGRGGFYHSELYDINSDGFLDLIIGGHEWENDFRILWGSINGFNVNNNTMIPHISTAGINYDMGILTDIKIFDINNDGVNEILLMRTGGDDEYGVSSYYAGWYIQVLSLIGSNQLEDVTSQVFENFYSDNLEDYCGNPYNNWIFWLNITDLDNDGNLDIHNKMLANRPFHRWEWNGSKFIKVSP